MTNREAGKLYSYKEEAFSETVLDQPVNPCGLVALSFFNDTYQLWKGEDIPINQEGIAWATDKEKKFKRAEDSTTT